MKTPQSTTSQPKRNPVNPVCIRGKWIRFDLGLVYRAKTQEASLLDSVWQLGMFDSRPKLIQSRMPSAYLEVALRKMLPVSSLIMRMCPCWMLVWMKVFIKPLIRIKNQFSLEFTRLTSVTHGRTKTKQKQSWFFQSFRSSLVRLCKNIGIFSPDSVSIFYPLVSIHIFKLIYVYVHF